MPADPAVLLGGFRAHGGEDLGPAGLADGVDAVLVGHVAHLMGQHRGELVLIFAGLDQPPGNEDRAPGTGKGVDFVGVQHREVVALERVGAGGFPGHGLPHFVDVLGKLGVLDQFILAENPGGHGPTHVVFLGIGDGPGGLRGLGRALVGNGRGRHQGRGGAAPRGEGHQNQ